MYGARVLTSTYPFCAMLLLLQVVKNFSQYHCHISSTAIAAQPFTRLSTPFHRYTVPTRPRNIWKIPRAVTRPCHHCQSPSAPANKPTVRFTTAYVRHGTRGRHSASFM